MDTFRRIGGYAHYSCVQRAFERKLRIIGERNGRPGRAAVLVENYGERNRPAHLRRGGGPFRSEFTRSTLALHALPLLLMHLTRYRGSLSGRSGKHRIISYAA